MRLIITRHGETEENKKGIIQGHIHGVLSELGNEQAKKVALRLKDEEIDYIFSSDLDRAYNTAKEIHKYHKGTPLIKTKKLREKFLGDFQGKEIGDEFWETMNNPNLSKEKNIETNEDLFLRAEKFINFILKNYFGKNILIVAHAGIGWAIISFLKDSSASRSFDGAKGIGNTSITVFEFNEDKNPSLVLSNCTKHLE